MMPQDSAPSLAMPRSKVLTFGLLTGLLVSGYGVMFTVLDDFRDEYGISETWLGLIVGIGFFASFLAQIFIAPVADRGYAKRLVFLGTVTTVVALVGMAYATSLLPLLGARFVMGIGIGMAAPAVRRIVIIGDPENLGRNLGLLLAADVSGFAMGPAISAILVGPFGLSAPFLVIAAANVLVLPILFWVDVDESDHDVPVARFAFDMFRNRSFLAITLLVSGVWIMIGTFDALWAVVLDDLEASEWVANIGITMFALPLIFLSPTGGRLAQRVGPFRLGPLGLIVGAVFIFAYGLMPTGGAMLAVALLNSVNDGLTISSGGIATGLAIAPERQASAQGMIGAVEMMTAAITATTAGILYEHFGRFTAYTACAVIMVVLGIASYVLAGPTWRQLRGVAMNLDLDPATAVTGHA